MVQVSKYSQRNASERFSQQDELASTCNSGSSTLSSCQLQDAECGAFEQTLDSTCIGISSRNSLREQGSMILAMMGQEVARNRRGKKDKKLEGKVQSHASTLPTFAAPVPPLYSTVVIGVRSCEPQPVKAKAFRSNKKIPNRASSENWARSWWPMDQPQSLGHQQHADLPLQKLDLPEHGDVNHNRLQPCANSYTLSKGASSPQVILPSYMDKRPSTPAWPPIDDFEPMKVALSLQRMPETSLFDEYFFDGYLSL
eukprot:TRINITY_DN16077_c0_g1_i1.p1 TRINITY_DN16077_c0_g1~~TRINITY_DN16077_c0_g1_i1.p1  ORF type:complete len:255 (-),score=40.50 TRINITY_DN16077_c0_g1_i1:153-917(-)